MASTFGNALRVTIFGQSHSAAIGAVVDGLPAGETLDMARIRAFMRRRAPGNAPHATARQEADLPEVLSGLVGDVTCGAPLCAVIHNTGQHSQDYEGLRDTPRPSHADFAAHAKYGTAHDIRGGGHFSGRLTAPLCFAGAVCLQLLERRGIHIGAHIHSLAGIPDTPYPPVAVNVATLQAAAQADFPVLDSAAGAAMQREIAAAKAEGDSVGGVIEGCAIGLPPGVGQPLFDGVENRLAAALFGIPAVKGVEFGSGFAGAAMRGSRNNDAFCWQGDTVRTRTNCHGGSLGGITSGMPLLCRVAVKPTPSIGQVQHTVSLDGKVDATLRVGGRHDPCILPRAVPVVEAVLAIALLDMLLCNGQ